MHSKRNWTISKSHKYMMNILTVKLRRSPRNSKNASCPNVTNTLQSTILLRDTSSSVVNNDGTLHVSNSASAFFIHFPLRRIYPSKTFCYENVSQIKYLIFYQVHLKLRYEYGRSLGLWGGLNPRFSAEIYWNLSNQTAGKIDLRRTSPKS